MEVSKLIISLFFMSIFLLSCNNSSSPENIAKEYTKAVMEIDYEAAANYVTDEVHPSYKDAASNLQKLDKNNESALKMIRTVINSAEFNVTEKKVSKNSATMTLSIKQKGSNFLEHQVNLIQEGNTWKVNQKAPMIDYEILIKKEHSGLGIALNQRKIQE